MSFTEEQIKQLDSILSNFIPLGSVISSTLDFKAFKSVNSEPEEFNDARSKWCPADGREISASRYAILTNEKLAPDFRGLFLRCMNIIDVSESNPVDHAQIDPEGLRSDLSVLQNDSTKYPNAGFVIGKDGSHTHKIVGHGALPGIGSGAGIVIAQHHGPTAISNKDTIENGEHSHIINGGDIETRPKNKAIYYYMKIN
jgi:hypothetical protein